MKKVCVLALVVGLVPFLTVSGVGADPRMETNDNFCHFILDINNTDNEIFVAGCDSSITVLEDPAEAGLTAGGREVAETGTDRTGYVASGYAKVVKKMPNEAAPLPPGEKLEFSSRDGVVSPSDGASVLYSVEEVVQPEVVCVMKESNDTEYKSRNWDSVVKVVRVNNRIVKVIHELFCWEGRVQN